MKPVLYKELTPRKRREVRDRYVEHQNGLCHYCKERLSGPPAAWVKAKPLKMSLFPPGFLDHRVHLHHSHKTGLTLGAVHAYCNGVSWQYDKT